ncbi:MAG: hypothetical protein RL358_671 [Pseudomonadota bacterium]|jgi:putative nucleotidyltransferase with HDIG domain
MTNLDTRTNLKQALAKLDSLPAMPVIAQKLLNLQLDTDAGEAQLLNLIEQDPQITAKLIGLANSPMMGVARKVSTVNDAAMLLGMTKVKAVAMGIAAMSGFAKTPQHLHFKPQDLWQHSITIAIIMRTIAAHMPSRFRPHEDQIFLAGLLHDIGYMALHHLDSAASDELHHQLHIQPKRDVTEIELGALGMTHGYIGAQLGKAWCLPSEIINVIAYHHPAHIEDVAEIMPLVKLLHLAERLLPDFGIAEHTGAGINDQEWLAIGILPSRAEELLDTTNEIAVQAANMSEMF